MQTSNVQLKLSRLSLPVRDVELMAAFYRDVLGFEQIHTDEPGTICVNIGGIALCLHSGRAEMRDDEVPGPTLVFFSPDVAQLRDELIEQGVHLGKLKSFGSITSCDGSDPEGNPFRISNQPTVTV